MHFLNTLNGSLPIKKLEQYQGQDKNFSMGGKIAGLSALFQQKMDPYDDSLDEDESKTGTEMDDESSEEEENTELFQVDSSDDEEEDSPKKPTKVVLKEKVDTEKEVS